MGFLTSIIGGSFFGLAARVGQLGIQKRNITDSASSSLPLGQLRE
jgi:hypothetical protein